MGAILAITQYRSGHYWIEIDALHFFSSTQSGMTIRVLNCMARWYSTPGSLVRCVVFPPSVRYSCSWYSSRRRAHEVGRVNFDPFTPSPSASTNRVGSPTVPKQTEMPLVSSIVCVRVVTMFDGKPLAVVRRTGWNV